MKAFIDNKLLRKLVFDETDTTLQALLRAYDKTNIPQHLRIRFGWTSLLEYLGESALLEVFPKLDEQSSLFSFLKTSLAADPTPDACFKLYDQIFAECLTLVKALPQINPEYLLNKIHQQQQIPSFTHTNTLFHTTLEKFTIDLTEKPSHAMHDLILYLGWDRICVVFAAVFDHIFNDANFKEGLKTFKECLIESFQHITQHGRTSPGFYRFVETFYAYQMRDENIKSHNDAEWQILCHSSYVLKPDNELPDVPYIDACIVHKEHLHQNQHHEQCVVFTQDSQEQVNARLDLVQFTMNKLQHEEQSWNYALVPPHVIYVKSFV